MLRNKEAAIESPSEKEKTHINEEEQSIDTPVVDNKKIKKCCKEANTMYNDMVKEAYEEICGEVEKEAYVKGYDKSLAGKAWGAVKRYGRTLAGKDVKAAKNQLNNLRDSYSHIYGGNENMINKMMESDYAKGIAEKMPKDIRNARLKRAGAAGATALGVAGAAYGGKKLYDKHQAKKSREEEVAEKAAAYYDEAQYIKEAAEVDYAEACAYEEAALQILDELGYLD